MYSSVIYWIIKGIVHSKLKIVSKYDNVFNAMTNLGLQCEHFICIYYIYLNILGLYLHTYIR